MYFNTSISFLLLLFLSTTASSNTETNGGEFVNISLEGKMYDILFLNVITDMKGFVKIRGQSENKKDWSFLVPDSLYERSVYMNISIPANDTTVHHISLQTSDSTSCGGYLFGRSSVATRLVFQNTDFDKKVPFYRYKDAISDKFSISKGIDSELDASIEDLHSRYNLYAIHDSLYDKQLQRNINITKKYPDSQSLISSAASTHNRYRSKKDLLQLFNHFSEKNKKSYFGKKINKYLTTTIFENMSLPLHNSDIYEPIVIDSTKYNLVVFSASWCGPCHVQIPILKEIYADLEGKLNITYISSDDKKTLENWNVLIEKEQIPWRSLLAFNDIQGVYNKYFVQGIPHSILIHPEGYFEVLDVRKENDINKLYELF